jgi:hypothetical protein
VNGKTLTAAELLECLFSGNLRLLTEYASRATRYSDTCSGFDVVRQTELEIGVPVMTQIPAFMFKRRYTTKFGNVPNVANGNQETMM